MATAKISALPLAALPLAGTELLEVVQGGSSTRVAASAVAAAYTTNPANVLPVANGGTGAATASAARTNLGATTVGSNLLTLANPGAITFPRINADNTVSALSAATFRTATGAAALGANSDITSLAGLTTALSVAQGGTGAATLTGYVKGNGTSAMTASATIPFADLAGRAYINAISTANQSGSTSTATAVTMNTNTAGVGINVNASTQITFTDAGTYFLAPSIHLANTAGADYKVTFWFRKNGVNITNSGTIMTVPKNTDGGVADASFQWVETVTAGQYIEIMFVVENISASIAITLAGAVAPAVPSVTVPVVRIA